VTIHGYWFKPTDYVGVRVQQRANVLLRRDGSLQRKPMKDVRVFKKQHIRESEDDPTILVVPAKYESPNEVSFEMPPWPFPMLGMTGARALLSPLMIECNISVTLNGQNYTEQVTYTFKESI
jgi:hypothetical protein